MPKFWETISTKTKSIFILQIADRQPKLLRRAIKLLPKILGESFSYTESIVVVSQPEYYLKYYLPQAISRCTYDLMSVLLSNDTTVIKKDSLQKLTNFFSRGRNCDSKETVADIIEELQQGSLVEKMVVAE